MERDRVAELIRLLEPEAFDTLSDHQRRGCIRALGETRDSRAAEALVRTLKYWRDSWTRDAMAEALINIGEPATLPMCKALGAAEAGIRWRAAMVLGRIGNARAVPLLCRRLKDGDWQVRSEAVEALGRIGDARAILPLMEVLKRPQWGISQHATSALSKIGDSLAIHPPGEGRQDDDAEAPEHETERSGLSERLCLAEQLCEALNDDHWRARRQAAVLLGKLGDARAIAPLCEALQKGSVEAAGALGEIALRQPVPELLAALPLVQQRLQAMPFFDSGKTERTLRIALERVEAALASIRALPIPAAAPLASEESLPVPASPRTPEVASLPAPAGPLGMTLHGSSIIAAPGLQMANHGKGSESGLPDGTNSPSWRKRLLMSLRLSKSERWKQTRSKS